MANYVARTDAFMASLGLEVYRVGGSVRDEILGRRVKDADYMVRNIGMAELGAVLIDTLRKSTGKPGSVKPLKLRDGRAAGWRVSTKGLGAIEITLPRKEVSTGPGHRDFKIALDPALSLKEDAKRRDFTFNALYKRVCLGHMQDDVNDPTGQGLYDLQHRFVRTTHKDSFRDDPLRTLRALRFVSVLGYDLAKTTFDEMALHASAVTGLTDKGVSGTMLDELNRLLMGNYAVKALKLARDTGVLAHVLPELAPMIGFEQGSKYHDLTTDEHTFSALKTAEHVEAPLRVRWALLFHDAGKPEAAWRGEDGRLHYYENNELHTEDHAVVAERLWLHAAKRLNTDRKLRNDVAKLIRNHMVIVDGRVKGSKVRRDRVVFGDELLRDLYMHRLCDLSGKGKPNRNHMAHVARQEELRREAQDAGVPASVKELQISGGDLLEARLKGKAIGLALHEVLDEVACNPNDQTLSREWQLERAVTHARSAQ